MRNFAFIMLIVGIVGVQSGFAQVRDLFAEFEEAAESSSAEVSSSAVASSSSEVPSSSSVVPSSSSIAVDVSSSSVAETVPADTMVAPVDSVVAESPTVATDSAAAIADSTTAIADSATVPVDTAAVSSSSEAPSSSSVQVAEPVVIPSSSSMSRRDLLGPVKVSKVYGIDEVKGKYRSPRKALFMSLVIPGSGQLYAGGNSFTYIRGGAYLALEAALWGGWYYFSVYKYDDQVSKYKKFAKNHFSVGRFEAQMRDIYLNQLSDESEESRFASRYMSSREDFCEGLYGKATDFNCYTKGKLFNKDKGHLDHFSITDPKSLGEEIAAQKGFYDESVVYQLISESSYVLGWDDVESVAIGQNLKLDDPAAEIVPLGSSKNQSNYRHMRNKANDYADMQAWFFGGIILNHLVSAIDAAFTANSHNKELYSEEISWYDRLHFDSYMNIFDGFDVGVQASWGF